MATELLFEKKFKRGLLDDAQTHTILYIKALGLVCLF